MISRFQISHDQFATFIPVYCIPHSKNGMDNIYKQYDAEENTILW